MPLPMQHEPYHHTADDQPPPLTVVAGELTPLEIRRIQLADAAVLRAKQLADFSSPEFRSALDADELGYNAVLLTQASLPHRDPHTNTWVRANGKRRLTILADPEIGVPWGSLPRLILI